MRNLEQVNRNRFFEGNVSGRKKRSLGAELVSHVDWVVHKRAEAKVVLWLRRNAWY